MESVAGVNALTARWVRAVGGSAETVLSGLGVWPLLAFLATGAGPGGRRSLEAALGASADQAAEQARELLTVLRGAQGVDAALGLWTPRDLILDPHWSAGLPADTHGLLTGDQAADSARLDAWAARETDGMVRRMPVVPRPQVRLVLASALAVRTRWLHPFAETRLRPAAGPWTGRDLAALRLSVQAAGMPNSLSVLATSAGPVTELRLPGAGEVDVHLLLGEEAAAPGEVLAAVLDRSAAGAGARIPMTALADGRPGPGLTVGQEPSTDREERLAVTTVPFQLAAEHDLLKYAELFGLEVPGEFPGISAEPLEIAQAAQAAVATFGPEGFRAGVVTAVAMTRGAARPQHQVRTVRVTFDRPFAWAAVHRPSGLALVAGWHSTPQPAR